MVIGVKNHGQQNLRQRAMKITPTGNENYANPFVFRKRRAYRFSFSSISFFFFCMRIYINTSVNFHLAFKS